MDLTNTDRTLTSTQKFYKTASKLEDALLLLQGCSNLLNDQGTSLNRHKETTKSIHGIVVPLISETVDSVRTGTIFAAPMSGMPKVHQHVEIQRKRDAKDK